MANIKIGILGYGNIGRGVEAAVTRSADMELVAVYSRRNPDSIKLKSVNIPVLPAAALDEGQDIDVLVLCGGSATDLPVQTPKYAAMYNVVDSFDNHSHIPEHFEATDRAAKAGKKTAIISMGWDPGLFSLNRALLQAVLPEGKTYTFWGKGVSQGHSDAVRRIDGVLDARQYTIPVENAIEAIRSGKTPDFSTREKHRRECFVVAAPGADKAKIEEQIKTMPAYFADYDTTVHFITQDEMDRHHSGMPHGGFVIRSGNTGEYKEICEFRLQLESNPEFTASILAAYARAAYRAFSEKNYGCKTILDIPPAYALPLDQAEILKTLI